MTDHVAPALPIDEVVSFEPPDGWLRVASAAGRCYAPRSDIPEYGDDAAYMPFVFGYFLVETPAGSDGDRVEPLMARRVPQGWPERFAAQIDGRAARGFDWTDGVNSILSWFVGLDDGRCVEVCFSKNAFIRTQPEPSMFALAEPLLARVRWLA